MLMKKYAHVGTHFGCDDAR